MAEYLTPQQLAAAATDPSLAGNNWMLSQMPDYGNLKSRQMVMRNLGDIIGAINKQALPTAQTELAVQQAISDPENALMLQQAQKYLPLFQSLGNTLNANALANEVNLLKGSGSDYLKAGYDAAQIFDKPYYDTRQLTADKLGVLLGSIDLSGGLSGTERDEIAKGLAREGSQRGTLNAPSNSDTVANAMVYGQAANQRQQQAKSNLAQALQLSTNFLPTAQTGVNPFATVSAGTTTSNANNQGVGLFRGITSGNNSAANNMASNLLGVGSNNFANALNAWTGLTNTQMNNDAQKKDSLDILGQGIGIAKGGIGAIGSIGSTFGLF